MQKLMIYAKSTGVLPCDCDGNIGREPWGKMQRKLPYAFEPYRKHGNSKASKESVTHPNA